MIKMLQSLDVLTERKKKKKKVHHQIQSSLNQQERSKIYKVKMKTRENMQTRETTRLQTVEPFLSEVRVVMMNAWRSQTLEKS